MNILEILHRDHKRFLAVLEQVDEKLLSSENKYYTSGFSGEAGKKALDLLRGLLPDLRRHEEAEQTLLFPALRRWAPQTEQQLEGMAEEHGGMEGLLKTLMEKLAQSSDRPMSRVLVDLMHMANGLRSHILREETGLYVLAEKSVPPAELERLGREAEKLGFPSV